MLTHNNDLLQTAREKGRMNKNIGIILELLILPKMKSAENCPPKTKCPPSFGGLQPRSNKTGKGGLKGSLEL